MPRYASSRPRTYKKRYSKKPYRPLTANSVAKIARRVTRAEKPVREVRFHDASNLITNTLASSFSAYHLTNIAQGEKIDQRDGNKVFVSGVKYNIVVKNKDTVSRYYRFCLVQEKNPSDTLDTTTWTDLYQDTNYADYTADMTVTDSIVPLNRDILTIHRDFVVHLGPAGADGDTKMLTGYVPISRKLMYGNEGDSTTPVNGKIYAIQHTCTASNVAGNANYTVSEAMYRMFYKDA